VQDEQWTLEPMAWIVFTRMNYGSSSDPYTTLGFFPMTPGSAASARPQRVLAGSLHRVKDPDFSRD
jgi:hypothetical protein